MFSEKELHCTDTTETVHVTWRAGVFVTHVVFGDETHANPLQE